jgi:outer membrane protein OmpA-like peptidoglycan-associated protein
MFSNQFISSSQSRAAASYLSDNRRGTNAEVGGVKRVFTRLSKLHWTLRLRALQVPVCAVLAASCAFGYAQTPKLPTELTFLTTFGKVSDFSPYKAWDKATFPRYFGAHPVDKLGHRWSVYITMPGPKDYKALPLMSKIKPGALQAGWTLEVDNSEKGFCEFHYLRNGVEAWANAFADFGYSDAHVNWEIIEIAPPPISVTLVEPSATPEKMPTGEKGDFPFLTPIPHSVPNGGRDSSAPWSLKWKGSSEMQTVASGTLDRSYKYPDLSSLLFGTVYHDALIKAGWDVDQSAPDQPIIAHYAKKGRNLWAYVNLGGDDYTIRVGKEGAPDQLKAGLAKDCHVALYGVLFDFNKSTLQPASDGALQQVAALMTANPSLKIEIQGHTDNVGGDAYNQTLSEARAHAVMTWLIAHNVTAARMTATGYGKTRPVADNNTDEGRMKNRRVEIADPSCKEN